MPTETWEHWVEERVCENEERMDAVSQKLEDTAVALEILRSQLERVQQMLDELRQEQNSSSAAHSPNDHPRSKAARAMNEKGRRFLGTAALTGHPPGRVGVLGCPHPEGTQRSRTR